MLLAVREDPSAFCSGATSHAIYLLRSDHLGWAGLRSALLEAPCITVVGEAVSGQQALAGAPTASPGVIVLPGTVGDITTPALIAGLRARLPDTPIVMILDRPDDAALLPPGERGVEACLLWREMNAGTFHRAVTMVVEDGCVIGSRAVAEAFFDGLRRRDAPGAALTRLTAAQRRVLALLVQDLTDEEIAAHLGIGVSTVGSHIHNLCDRLGVKTRSGLGVIGCRAGLAASDSPAPPPTRGRSSTLSE